MTGLKVRREPHFGLVRAGGVYTQTITIHNQDPIRCLRPIIIAPLTSQRQERGGNKARIFLRDAAALAPGTKMSVDIVLFAAEQEDFVDHLEIRTVLGTIQVLEIRACILAPSSWMRVLREFRWDNLPPLRPGVAFMGMIDKGTRKHIVTSENLSQRRPKRNLFSTDRDLRYAVL